MSLESNLHMNRIHRQKNSENKCNIITVFRNELLTLSILLNLALITGLVVFFCYDNTFFSDSDLSSTGLNECTCTKKVICKACSHNTVSDMQQFLGNRKVFCMKVKWLCYLTFLILVEHRRNRVQTEKVFMMRLPRSTDNDGILNWKTVAPESKKGDISYFSSNGNLKVFFKRSGFFFLHLSVCVSFNKLVTADAFSVQVLRHSKTDDVLLSHATDGGKPNAKTVVLQDVIYLSTDDYIILAFNGTEAMAFYHQINYFVAMRL